MLKNTKNGTKRIKKAHSRNLNFPPTVGTCGPILGFSLEVPGISAMLTGQLNQK